MKQTMESERLKCWLSRTLKSIYWHLSREQSNIEETLSPFITLFTYFVKSCELLYKITDYIRFSNC